MSEPKDPMDEVMGDPIKAMREQAKAEKSAGVKFGAAFGEVGKILRGSRPGQWWTFISLGLAFWASVTDGHFSAPVFFVLWFILWLIGLPFRFGGWVSRKLNSRPCPVCGMDVPKGRTVCESCGTDFRLL